MQPIKDSKQCSRIPRSPASCLALCYDSVISQCGRDRLECHVLCLIAGRYQTPEGCVRAGGGKAATVSVRSPRIPAALPPACEMNCNVPIGRLQWTVLEVLSDSLLLLDLGTCDSSRASPHATPTLRRNHPRKSKCQEAPTKSDRSNLSLSVLTSHNTAQPGSGWASQ